MHCTTVDRGMRNLQGIVRTLARIQRGPFVRGMLQEQDPVNGRCREALAMDVEDRKMYYKTSAVILYPDSHCYRD